MVCLILAGYVPYRMLPLASSVWWTVQRPLSRKLTQHLRYSVQVCVAPKVMTPAVEGTVTVERVRGHQEVSEATTSHNGM